MHPEDMTFRMLILESIAVFNSHLGFPVKHVSKMSIFIIRHTYPTPPMPASARRLWISNCLPISVIIYSQPMNFESLSNGTAKHAVRDGDTWPDKFADTKTRLSMSA
jgi:hypothetical protein